MYVCTICESSWEHEPADYCPYCEESVGVEARKKPGGGRRKQSPAAAPLFDLFEDDPDLPPASAVDPLLYPVDKTLGAKEWEKLTLDAIAFESRHRTLTGNRYGVQASFSDVECPCCKKTFKGWRPISSLPDFEGLLMEGPKFVIENKTISSRKSLDLNDDKLKKRQLKNMKDQAEFGAICFLFVHFNPRQLKKGPTDSQTFAFPVAREHPFWILHEAGEVNSLSPEVAAQYGWRVPWPAKYKARTPRPDVLGAVQAIMRLRDESWPDVTGENALDLEAVATAQELEKPF